MPFTRFFMSLCVLACCQAALAQGNVVTILGRVTDQNTGQAIAGVAVSASGNQTGTRVAVSDANGNYTLPLGSNTNIKLRAYRTNYVFSPLSVEFTSFGPPISGTRTQDYTGALLPFPILIFAQPAVLLTQDDSLNALALDSVTHTRDPFIVTNPNYFGADRRTRVKLFVFDLDLYSGETLGIVSVTAQDSQQGLYNLPVEDLRKVPGVAWLSQLTVRLPPELAGPGEIGVTVTARNQVSNRATLRVGP